MRVLYFDQWIWFTLTRQVGKTQLRLTADWDTNKAWDLNGDSVQFSVFGLALLPRAHNGNSNLALKHRKIRDIQMLHSSWTEKSLAGKIDPAKDMQSGKKSEIIWVEKAIQHKDATGKLWELKASFSASFRGICLPCSGHYFTMNLDLHMSTFQHYFSTRVAQTNQLANSFTSKSISRNLPIFSPGNCKQ